VATEVARASGEVDGVRLPKQAYYVCQVMFSLQPRVHIVGHWTYPAGTRKTVHVAANTGGDVELLLNGRSLGRASAVNRYSYSFPEVPFEAGELTAIARDADGRIQARHTLQTTGAAVALRLTPIVGPDGWRADGADVALFDVEAVDAAGRRVPTFQQRVEFSLKGAGVWRGGYNSGRIGTINRTQLDLEAGINRVSVRSTAVAGRVELSCRAEGLRPASTVLMTVDATGRSPAWPRFALPESPRREPQPAPAPPSVSAARAADHPGRFIHAFNYSGPNASIVHVERGATQGRNAYVDCDSPFPKLPPVLEGADWVQVDNRDALFHAVDLMELTVEAGSTVYIAHDTRLPVPPWLLRDYAPAGLELHVKAAPMAVYSRKLTRATGLTLGPNTEDSTAREGNMYLVWVAGSAAVP
jgi:beta-galactosidase